jgi:hypothetical protein
MIPQARLLRDRLVRPWITVRGCTVAHSRKKRRRKPRPRIGGSGSEAVALTGP